MSNGAFGRSGNATALRRRARIAVLSGLLAASGVQAQQLKTYTQSLSGPQYLTYGLPVPLPIPSLTPVDGFRNYDSVQARLQSLAMQSDDLSAHDVGRTFANRTVWAYVASDADAIDVEGRPEAAFFINASTHAREWGTPEVSTGTVERLMAGAGDGGIVRYVLDNTRLVILPVHNIDGVLQTQRFPTEVLVGQDPDVADWPRDGRMRRKTMRGVDEVLTTTGDHLLGVDLNRNHPPFYATAPTRSSSNPNSLVHHGAAPHSEPENQALLAAARLAPETRLRLGVDLHSFSRVFYSSNTSRTRLNLIQGHLIEVMADHHEALSGTRYDDVPDPANRGIGAAAEYFAYQWLVPAWTLELEPRDSAFEYGGTNVSHGGFILPASEARRVRESWAETHLVAFYRMAGPPHLARVRWLDAQTGALAAQVRWQWNPQAARRERVVDVAGALAAGRRYRVELAFSKPMRYRDAAGQVAPLPGIGFFPGLVPGVTLVQGGARTALDTSGGRWLDDPARVLRYRDDSFAFEFTAPAAGEAVLEVSAQDMTGQSLDADPSTAVDWAEGAWSEYENVAGIDGDLGGPDRTTTFAASAAPASQASLVGGEALAGEGDAAALRVARAPGGAGRLELRSAGGAVLASWAAGESGERSVSVPIPDDAVAAGDRNETLALVEFVDGAPGATLAVPVRVLDNDDAERAVWRVHDSAGFATGWNALAAQPRGELVLSGAAAYSVAATTNESATLAPVTRELSLHGNGAQIDEGGAPVTHSRRFIEVAPAGTLVVDRVGLGLSAAAGTSMDLGRILNAGNLRFERSHITADGTPVPFIRNAGALALRRSSMRGDQSGPHGALVLQSAGSLAIDASSLLAADASLGYAGDVLALDGGTAIARNSSLAGGQVVNDNATTTLQLQASRVDEFKGEFQLFDRRTACPQPVMAGLGGNVFSADYGDSDAAGFLESGCFTLAGTDVFDPTARVLPVPASPPLFPLPAGWSRADRVTEAQCSAVDQRGAPRPQGLASGVPARCEAGSYEIGINPYRGIWSPARSGHGVDLQTAGNRLFLAWYTYEDDGEPTAYQAAAPFTGPHWEATLQQSSRNPQTGAVTVRDVGTVSLDFADDTHATLGWRFDARGTAGSEALTAALFAPGEPRVEVTGLWYPPAESGHGATISRRGDLTAVGVYYYDAQGNVRWALGTGSGADAQRLALTSFRGFCPDCSAAANPVAGTPAGNALLHFHTPAKARVDLELTYPGAAGGQWNRSGARFVPLNDPVDNRDALRTD